MHNRQLHKFVDTIFTPDRYISYQKKGLKKAAKPLKNLARILLKPRKD
jgi:FMN-dependent NADH-azoreductase